MGDVEHAVQPITECVVLPTVSVSPLLMEPFRLLSRASPNPNKHVTLSCSVPTWTPALANIGLDMHDLNDLRARSLAFIHNLVKALRAVGVC